jgi:hypothetical protein
MLFAAKLIEPRRSTVRCRIRQKMTAAKLPATTERRNAAVATYSMERPLAPLMGPEHPAGDERNRTQENGNTVTMFHPPRHSSLPIRKKPRALGAWASPSHKPRLPASPDRSSRVVVVAAVLTMAGQPLIRRVLCGPDGLMGVGRSTAPMLVSSMLGRA